MNRPPTDGICVPAAALHQLVHEIFVAVPITDQHARLIADLLIDTDLRGVVSHGVMQVERYFTDFRSGATNTHPQLRILRESASTAALSSDGGLGYIAGCQAMDMAMAKAREGEMTALVEEMSARVKEAEAEIPQAIAEAFRAGNFGVMDYYRMRNIQSDTDMRSSISESGDDPDDELGR